MVFTLIRTHKENYNVQTFWFKPARRFGYTAGQFIEMYLPHDNPDDRGIKRWFTLSSSPTEDLVSISTKFAGDTASSFKKTLFSLKIGAEIKIVEPMGDFVLPKDTSIPLIFVAGGMGITPFRSIIKWLSDTKENRKITLLYTANSAPDFIFIELFKSYGITLIQMVAEPGSNWKGEIGRLTAEKILEVTGTPVGKLIYVSGPEPMVETLEKDLHQHGVSKDQLVLDFFPGYRADLK